MLNKLKPVARVIYKPIARVIYKTTGNNFLYNLTFYDIHTYTNSWRNKKMTFLGYFIRRNINKIITKLKPLPRYNEEDITSIIPVKNRYDYKIINALKSIRNQDYDQDLIKIIVIDYDSKKEFIPKLKKLCKEYKAEYIRVENKLIWNVSHANNIALKRTNSKYVLITNTDFIFKEDYIKEAIKELQKNPRQIIVSNHWVTKEGDIRGEIDVKKDYNKIIKKCNLSKTIGGYKFNPGISIGLTQFYKKINGFNEEFKKWGYEDNDLLKRLELSGLNIKDVSEKSSYFHQWHPTIGKKSKEFKKQEEKNLQLFLQDKSIKRNKTGWGEL